MSAQATEFYRLDPLTGCNNFLSFVEALNCLSAGEKKHFSILYTDMNYLEMLNESKGRAYGDSAIRWLGIVLQEECHAEAYRIGWDDFAVLLTAGAHLDHEDLLKQIFARSIREGEQLGIPSPPARIALVHYEVDHDFSIHDVLFHLWEAIRDVKTNKDRTINIFRAQNLIRSTTRAEEQTEETIHHSWEVLRAIANQAINQVLSMGRVLDIAQKNSFLDSISGLPNLPAAMLKLEKEIASGQPFSILLIDGDNLRRYNSISYAAGDEMIQNLGKVLSENLRPDDFLARWRTGDEMIVVLPKTAGEDARVVGERFCSAIREASKNWTFPTSVSVGVATYPKHGCHVNELVDVAEAANKRAKDQGKDRVVLAV